MTSVLVLRYDGVRGLVGLESRLRRVRQALGLRITDVAEKLGTSPQVLHNWEHGVNEPSLRMALRLAWLYGLSVEELFADYDDTKDRFDPDQEFIMSLIQGRQQRNEEAEPRG